MAVQITIRNVPAHVRDELAARVARQGKSMQEYLRSALERMAASARGDRSASRPGFAPVAARVWQLRHALTSYDAWYVAVAEAVEPTTGQLDSRLTRADGPACAFLLPQKS